MSVLHKAFDVFAVLTICDLTRYQDRHLLDCRGCHSRIDADDKFCRRCGLAEPLHVPARDPDRQFRATGIRMVGECYPPMHWGPTPDDAITALIDEVQRKAT